MYACRSICARVGLSLVYVCRNVRENRGLSLVYAFVYRSICGAYLSRCSCIELYLVYNLKMFVYNVFV